MPNPENIVKHKFKKGTTGNPNGRPKKLPDLQMLLAEVLGKETNGKTAAQKILDALQKKAARGDVRASELLLDRGWGKVKQGMEFSGSKTHPIILNFVKPEDEH